MSYNDDCICVQDDDSPFSGFSVCGVPCPVHPPSQKEIEEVRAVREALRKVFMDRKNKIKSASVGEGGDENGNLR